MPECAKTHLQQSRISKFSGGGPLDPLFKGRGGEGGEREGGRGRIGTGGKEGRNGGGGEGRGARHGLRPLETSSGSAPAVDFSLHRLSLTWMICGEIYDTGKTKTESSGFFRRGSGSWVFRIASRH